MPRRTTPVPLVANLTDFEPVADALVDKLTLTCHLTFPRPQAGGAAGLRARLAAARLLGANDDKWAKVTFRWTCPNSGEHLWLDGSLTLTEGANGAVFAAGSSRLDISLLRLLREQVTHDCGAGLDGGALNVVGPPEGDRPHLLGLQLATVSGLLDAFLLACAAASGSPVSAKLWIRAVELNRDLLRADAAGIAHRLAGETNPWHRVGWVRHYHDDADTAHDGNYVTVTWPNDRADAPIRMKFYAKTAELLRTEVCCDNREAVRLCAGRGAEAWPDGPATGGAGVAERLAILARATLPLLDAMSAHVARLDAPQREVLALIVALAPLLRAGALPPPRRAGARPGAQTQADVKDVLYHLLALGRFDASGLRTNSTVRKALNRIVAEGGLLAESLGRAPLYAVPPSYSAARGAMRRALWPDRTGEPRPVTRQLTGGLRQ